MAVPRFRSRTLGAIPALLGVVVLGAPLASSQSSPPQIQPGQTHRFAVANGMVVHDAPPALAERSVFGNPPPFALWNGDAPLDPGTFARASSVATAPLSIAKVVVTVQNDFEVAAGIRGDEPIAAQISAHVSVRGFLALLGAGKARGKVELKILDVTGKAPYAVDSHEVLKEDIEGALKPQIGVNVAALVPVPDGEAGLSVDFETEGQRKLIDDNCDIGRLVLLQRGHRYRVLLELETIARTGVIGGLADAEFWMQTAVDRQALGLDPAPNLMKRTNWRGAVGEIARLLSFSNLDDSQMRGYLRNATTTFLGEEGAARLLPLLSRDTISVRAVNFGTAESIASVLRDIGLPGTLDVAAFVDWLPEPSLPADDLIEGLGVKMTDLAVTLASDTSAADRRDLEASLASNQVLVSLYLPAAAGGRLEEILFLVGELIDRSKSAGIATGTAALDLDAAVQLEAAGAYKRSYVQACKAYRRLLSSAR